MSDDTTCFLAEARRLVEQGGLYLNNERVDTPSMKLEHHHLIDGRLAILRAGRNNHLILALHHSKTEAIALEDAQSLNLPL